MPQTPQITGRAIKVTIVLDAAAVLAHPVPETGRVVLRIRAGERTVSADIAAKSLRKCQATIKEHGVDGVAVIIQGKLAAKDEIIEAGLTAQPRIKPSTQSAKAAAAG